MLPSSPSWSDRPQEFVQTAIAARETKDSLLANCYIYSVVCVSIDLAIKVASSDTSLQSINLAENLNPAQNLVDLRCTEPDHLQQ
jgi:hypothetical protein